MRRLLLFPLVLIACGSGRLTIAAEPDQGKSPPSVAKEQKAEVKVQVEHAKPLPRSGLLGTASYQASDAEKEFVAHWSKADEAMAAESVSAEDLTGKIGKAVSWFGIVRKVTEDKQLDQTRLLLEMKYFDGLSDIDLLVVSIYGAGDFVATIPGTGHGIKQLELARVYGTVTKEEKQDKQVIPEVAARYVRDWDWGLFTFMDYGNDKSNPQWQALRKVSGTDVYSFNVDKEFYEDRLGKRD